MSSKCDATQLCILHMWNVLLPSNKCFFDENCHTGHWPRQSKYHGANIMIYDGESRNRDLHQRCCFLLLFTVKRWCWYSDDVMLLCLLLSLPTAAATESAAAWSALYCTVHHYTALHCTVLYSTVLAWTVQHIGGGVLQHFRYLDNSLLHNNKSMKLCCKFCVFFTTYHS